MRHVEYLVVLVAGVLLIGALGLYGLRYADRTIPEPKPLVPGHADDAVLAAKLAAGRPMAVRPRVPGGWRETEPAPLDPRELNALLEEARRITADNAAP